MTEGRTGPRPFTAANSEGPPLYMPMACTLPSKTALLISCQAKTISLVPAPETSSNHKGTGIEDIYR
eukprot:CAMPEP_0172826734 /NCGR_PEP_ID=MMETSP1075-20121228/19623_1 /TAXON_ID=2916 /ORGANISM="Ceratium fusus, Strain PA161109" /LENGTH=66 /DNA_ID=CAMNT_0013668433 /DNA_START=379 /DNA_END=579 /DNA_ORIENTATION=-